MWRSTKELLGVLANLVQLLGVKDWIVTGSATLGTVVWRWVKSDSAEQVGIVALISGLVLVAVVLLYRLWFGRVPLKKAARLAYNATLHSMTAEMARRESNGNPNEVYNFLAIAITAGGVKIWGKRYASDIVEEIPANVRTGARIINGGTELYYWSQPAPEYTALSVLGRDMRTAIKRINRSDALFT
jgi:hypothetical protein